jgi:flavin-dependent dehydrogenase
MRDLIIAGGGPIGLATGLYAARAGLDVVIREPRDGPIDKACGEGLMPGAVADLTDLGVPLDGKPITGIRYVDQRRHVDAAFRSGPGRGVRRTTLHDALADRLKEEGVVVERRRVESVEQVDGHVLVDGEPSRFLVAADGLHSPVRRLLGLDRPEPGRRRHGLRCHIAQPPWTSYVEVHWARDAEAYVTPVGDDQIGVALLTDRVASFEALLDGFPLLRERLTGPRSKVMGAGPLRQLTGGRTAGRVLLVGDAAGYVDALTGEGIAVGLGQARAAVAAIAAGRPEAYERAARRLGWRHDLLTRALLEATAHAPVRRRIVPLAERAPWLFSAAVNQLARPV